MFIVKERKYLTADKRGTLRLDQVEEDIQKSGVAQERSDHVARGLREETQCMQSDLALRGRALVLQRVDDKGKELVHVGHHIFDENIRRGRGKKRREGEKGSIKVQREGFILS